jgi:quercetin dioxygenase-like cupin family protein
MGTTEAAGRVFQIGRENPWVPGCTISETVSAKNAQVPVIHFSLAPHTSISREIYSTPKFWIVSLGNGEAEEEGRSTFLTKGDLYTVPTEVPVGVRTKEDGLVYTEVIFGKETKMNEILRSGEVFALKDLVPYQDGKIVNMDLVHDEHGKLALMSLICSPFVGHRNIKVLWRGTFYVQKKQDRSGREGEGSGGCLSREDQ